jgi:hypothetical protein
LTITAGLRGSSSLLETEEPFKFNSDVAMVSSDEIDEHVHEVAALYKSLEDLKSKHSVELAELHASHSEEMKKAFDRHKSVLFEEQCKYDSMKTGE